MTIYIARHGETLWNAQNRICGWADIPLTEKGKKQAELLAEEVRGKGITCMVASPLGRAQMTAQIANTHIQVPIQTDARIMEQCFGDFEGTSRATKEYLEAKRNIASRFPGGESILDLTARVYAFLDELPQKYAGETVLLVCHGVVSRVVHSYFEDLPIDVFGDYKLENCGLKKYEYSCKPVISMTPEEFAEKE